MSTSLWDWQLVWTNLPYILEGFQITVEATLMGAVLALSGGFVLCFLKLARLPGISLFIWLLIEFLRGTPFLVQLYFIFYVLPAYGVLFSPLTTGVLSLGLYGAARAAEFYRSAIEAIPHGQWEASLVLGLPLRGMWTRVMFPQIWPLAVPMLGNLVILMFKDTALLSTITVMEMVARAKDIGSQSFHYLEPLTIAGFLYWAVSYSVAKGLRYVENRHVRRSAG